MEWIGISSSALKVYINGKMEEDTSLKYPDVNELVNSYIGTCIPISNAFVQIPTEITFYGQIGTFILFSEALSGNAVSEIFTLGYNYMPNFHEKDILTRNGAPNIVCLQSPKTIEKDTIFNLGQYQQSIEKGLMNILPSLPSKKSQDPNGKLMGTTSTVTVSDIKDTFYSACGVQSLLPLFQHIQQTQVLHSSTINSLLTLMSDLFDSHPANQEEFLDCNGFALLGFIFQKISGNMDYLVVGALDKLINTISHNEPLTLEVYKHVIFHFDIWITTPYPIQHELTHFILKSVQRQPQLFRKHFGVQLFLDILRNYYWFNEETPDAQFKIFGTGSRSLTETQIRALRHHLLQCIESILVDTVELEEIQSIIFFLQDCTESNQLVDGLKLVFNLLSVKPPIKMLLTHLETLGGLKVFICGISRMGSVCVMSYKVIGKFL